MSCEIFGTEDHTHTYLSLAGVSWPLDWWQIVSLWTSGDGKLKASGSGRGGIEDLVVCVLLLELARRFSALSAYVV